eukprot:m.68697 g.68697  ORF g.68697 m.68697 type:complete len:319 (+) comp8253_c4_seq1:68-1024(+)
MSLLKNGKKEREIDRFLRLRREILALPAEWRQFILTVVNDSVEKSSLGLVPLNRKANNADHLHEMVVEEKNVLECASTLISYIPLVRGNNVSVRNEYVRLVAACVMFATLKNTSTSGDLEHLTLCRDLLSLCLGHPLFDEGSINKFDALATSIQCLLTTSTKPDRDSTFGSMSILPSTPPLTPPQTFAKTPSHLEKPSHSVTPSSSSTPKAIPTLASTPASTPTAPALPVVSKLYAWTSENPLYAEDDLVSSNYLLSEYEESLAQGGTGEKRKKKLVPRRAAPQAPPTSQQQEDEQELELELEQELDHQQQQHQLQQQ